MPTLTIRHVTTYRYRRPVAFGEHRMMLRPRDSHDQRVIEASLEISPEPRSLRFVQDAFGNHESLNPGPELENSQGQSENSRQRDGATGLAPTADISGDCQDGR